jgi:hypothetical protein
MIRGGNAYVNADFNGADLTDVDLVDAKLKGIKTEGVKGYRFPKPRS